jgi:hypothetical protein
MEGEKAKLSFSALRTEVANLICLLVGLLNPDEYFRQKTWTKISITPSSTGAENSVSTSC